VFHICRPGEEEEESAPGFAQELPFPYLYRETRNNKSHKRQASLVLELSFSKKLVRKRLFYDL